MSQLTAKKPRLRVRSGPGLAGRLMTLEPFDTLRPERSSSAINISSSISSLIPPQRDRWLRSVPRMRVNFSWDFFLFFLFITDANYLRGWPVSLFLEATPLVAGIATAAHYPHDLPQPGTWGLVIIAITMMVGRVWCNWMCPFGILHHFFGWIGNRRNTKQMIEVNRYRKIYAIKYYILAVMIAMASLWMIPTAIDAPRPDLACLSRNGTTADRYVTNRGGNRDWRHTSG